MGDGGPYMPHLKYVTTVKPMFDMCISAGYTPYVCSFAVGFGVGGVLMPSVKKDSYMGTSRSTSPTAEELKLRQLLGIMGAMLRTSYNRSESYFPRTSKEQIALADKYCAFHFHDVTQQGVCKASLAAVYQTKFPCVESLMSILSK